MENELLWKGFYKRKAFCPCYGQKAFLENMFSDMSGNFSFVNCLQKGKPTLPMEFHFQEMFDRS